MSIVPLRKVNLFGPADRKRPVLKALHELGILHLIPFDATTGQDATTPVSGNRALERAIAFLMEAPVKRRQLTEAGDADPAAVTAKVLTLHDHIRELQDRRDTLTRRIQALKPWGDIRLPSMAAIRGYRMWV
jgi:vacuolar-type H+-ATPase subunit I/STV1